MELEIGAGACPLVAVFLDEVDLGRIADGVDAEAFLGLGSDQRAVLGAFFASLKLCLSHDKPPYWVVKVLNEAQGASLGLRLAKVKQGERRARLPICAYCSHFCQIGGLS